MRPSAQRRALFVNPPLYVGQDFIDYPTFANHNLLAAAARTARAGWAVSVVDAFALRGSGKRHVEGWTLVGARTSEVEHALPDGPFATVVVGSSPFLRPHAPHSHTAALVRHLRERYPDAALVLGDCDLGGMHYVDAGGDAALAALPELDAYVRFAGEHTFSDPERLVALRGTRAVVDEPARAWGDDVPPFPLLEAIDVRAYGAFLERCFGDGRWANPFGIDRRTLPLITSSGCPHRCIFCSSNPGWRSLGAKAYRAVPAEVVGQWAYLAARGLGARKLVLLDEIANMRADFTEVLAALEGAGVRYEIPNGLRADRLTDEHIARMKDRVSLLSVSAESGSAEDLRGPIGKRLDLASIERVAKAAKEHGVPLLVHYIIGFPWETRAHVLRTLEHAWDLYERHGATPAVQYATPLRGTELHALCVEQGLVADGGADSTDGSLFQHRPAFRPPAIPDGWLERARETLDQKIHASRQRKVIVNITYRCINRCEFCATGDRDRRAIPWERLRGILLEHRGRGIENLDIDGGEPLLHPNVLEALALAKTSGYRQINLTTNGRKLKDRELAGRLLTSGITSLLISLHGPTAEIHDAITGVSRSFDEALAGIRNAVAQRTDDLDLGVNVTVSRKNVEHLTELAALVFAEGVYKLNLQLVTPFGNASAGVVPPLEQAARACCDVIHRFADRMTIYVVNGQPCFFAGYEAYLLADMQKLGRTMVFVSEEGVNLFDYLAARRVRREQCGECVHALVCEGFYEFSEGPSDVRAPRR